MRSSTSSSPTRGGSRTLVLIACPTPLELARVRVGQYRCGEARSSASTRRHAPAPVELGHGPNRSSSTAPWLASTSATSSAIASRGMRSAKGMACSAASVRSRRAIASRLRRFPRLSGTREAPDHDPPSGRALAGAALQRVARHRSASSVSSRIGPEGSGRRPSARRPRPAGEGGHVAVTLERATAVLDPAAGAGTIAITAPASALVELARQAASARGRAPPLVRSRSRSASARSIPAASDAPRPRLRAELQQLGAAADHAASRSRAAGAAASTTTAAAPRRRARRRPPGRHAVGGRGDDQGADAGRSGRRAGAGGAARGRAGGPARLIGANSKQSSRRGAIAGSLVAGERVLTGLRSIVARMTWARSVCGPARCSRSCASHLSSGPRWR